MTQQGELFTAAPLDNSYVRKELHTTKASPTWQESMKQVVGRWLVR